MKNPLFILIISLLFCSLFVTGCGKHSNLSTIKPADFAFTLNYGVGGKNKLDTFTNSYSRDMISEPQEDIQLTLSDEELNEIYSIMRNVNLRELFFKIHQIVSEREEYKSMTVPKDSYM